MLRSSEHARHPGALPDPKKCMRGCDVAIPMLQPLKLGARSEKHRACAP